MWSTTCSALLVPVNRCQIRCEIIREEDNLQPEYVELDEGIDNDYIEGELSLNDDLEGEGYDEHMF